MARTLLIISLAIAATAVHADPMSDGKSWAEGLLPGVPQSIDADVVPGYEGTDIAEADYYNAGLSVEEAAVQHSMTDENALFLYEGMDERPHYAIDRFNDPMMKNFDANTDMATMLGTTYAGCQELAVGGTIEDRSSHTCSEYGQREMVSYECTRRLVLDGGMMNGFNLLDGGDINIVYNGISDGSRHPTRITFQLDLSTNRYRVMTNRQGGSAGRNEQTPWVTNGANAPHPHYRDATITVSWGVPQAGTLSSVCTIENAYLHATREHTTSGCPSHILSLPGYTGNGRSVWNFVEKTYLLGWRAYEPNIEFDESFEHVCDDGREPGAGLLTSECVEGPETRVVNGFSTYRECWAWKETYERPGDVVYALDSQCESLLEAGCGQLSSVCAAQGAGFCAIRTLTFECLSQAPERTTLLCGEQLVCADGECGAEYQEHENASSDFLHAATAMTLAQEIMDEFDGDYDVSLFTGDDKKCRNHNFGFSNCCSGSGWGNDAGLSQCDSESVELGFARQAGRAHHVGNYTSGSWPDEREYRVFCVYPSKLARIIIQQGNAQMGRTYGTPRAPSCTGFTIDEMEALDFDAMDLSEYYGDMAQRADGVQTPDPSAVIDHITNRYQNVGGGNP